MFGINPWWESLQKQLDESVAQVRQDQVALGFQPEGYWDAPVL